MTTTDSPPESSLFDSLKAYVGFDAASSALLAAAHPRVAARFRAIVDDSCAAIAADPGARSWTTGGAAQVDRLEQTLLAWMNELFLGPHDDAYYDRRYRVGRGHVRIVLPQTYLFAAVDRMRLRIAEALRATISGPVLDPTTAALHQILDLELAIIFETYREDLLLKNRAAERLATIGQFAAGIGHELRNPLGVMHSSLFLLRQRMDHLGVADPQLLRHLDKIGREIEHSTKTIDDLLALSANRRPNRRRVTVGEVVDRAQASLQLPPSVEVVQACDGVRVDADCDQLAHVLRNLILNGSQAMDGKGHLWVEAHRAGTSTVMRVRDEGPGVTLEVRDRIFEPLFTTKAAGNGLGLALSQRIVEAHGGTLALDQVDRGAAFVVTIPDGPA